mgnify:CR=1 FL=1|tara:strand:+ start:7651 stop:8535 length:885 start_codon:yes stop_codon:yes gene_type:complete
MNNFVCFGEVLFDVFPEEKKIGGAPLNVACRLKYLGNNVAIISAIGNDENGIFILDFLKNNAVDVSHISVLDNLKTGEVQITLNSKGNASYTINQPVAWDKIPITKNAEMLTKYSDAFIFGSLSSRDEVSKKALYHYINFASYPVFDVNLRAPFYTKEILVYLMNKAKFIKFNDEELNEIAIFLESPYRNLEQNLNFISKKTDTNHICVTKGEHGGVLLYNNELYYNSGYQVKVKDTVGAGDSFLATLLSNLFNNSSPQKAIDTACAVGAIVTSNNGANPVVTLQTIERFMYPE